MNLGREIGCRAKNVCHPLDDKRFFGYEGENRVCHLMDDKHLGRPEGGKGGGR